MAKTKYETHVQPKLKLIEAWARDGLTLDQIAHNLSVAKSTLCEYQNRHSDLSDALKRSRDEADIEVENALYRNATGYYYDEDVVTNKGEVVRIQKYSQPNTTAQIFWLKNRKPKDWRDKQEHEHTGADGGAIIVNHSIPRPSKA